ncbi:MAG TPA: YbaK/EbsC family protein [Candidatus Koribacter sp.]|jgi:Ala-tRNA(Pro) deacylase
MPVQRLKDFLDKNDIRYILISHSRAFTAAATAAITHIPGKEIAKTVIVKINGELAMAVVPGSRHLDLKALQEELGARQVTLVGENEFNKVFPDCELGAMPPFGSLYGLTVYMDTKLQEDHEVAFNAGSHRELMRMEFDDYERLEHPRILCIATRSKHERMQEERVGAHF